MAKHIFWEEDLSFMEDPENIHVLLIRDPTKQLAAVRLTTSCCVLCAHISALALHVHVRGSRGLIHIRASVVCVCVSV